MLGLYTVIIHIKVFLRTLEQTRDAMVLKVQKTQQPQSLLTLSLYGLTAICLLFILSLSSSLALSDVKVLAVLSCGHFRTLLVSFAYISVWRLHELDGSLWGHLSSFYFFIMQCFVRHLHVSI